MVRLPGCPLEPATLFVRIRKKLLVLRLKTHFSMGRIVFYSFFLRIRAGSGRIATIGTKGIKTTPTTFGNAFRAKAHEPSRGGKG